MSQKFPSFLLRVDERSKHALFHAVELGRIYIDYLEKQAISRKAFRYLYDNQAVKLVPFVKSLLKEADIPLNSDEYGVQASIDQIQKLWDKKHPLQYKIFVFSKMSKKPIYQSAADHYLHPICIYLNNSSGSIYFDLIKTLATAMGSRYYCLTCESCYYNPEQHSMSCKNKCPNCRRVGPLFPCREEKDVKIDCMDCGIKFTNNDCHKHHLDHGVCSRFKNCPHCGVNYSLKDNQRDGRKGHVCGEKFCSLCKQWHKTEDYCMIAPLRLKQRKPYRMIVYDFECTQDEEANIGQKKRFRHKPNFISATIICTECIDKGCWDKTLPPNGCDICGEHRTMTWAPFEFQGTEVCKKVTTTNPLKSFVEWLLFEQESRHKSICFAHYGGRYDMTFILGEFLRQRRQNEFIPLPELILNGSKMYEMKVKKGKQNPEIWFRDSYNLMPIALSGLVKAWGLQISEKQHFPHMFNRMRNLNNVLPHLPPKEDYLMDQLKKEQLEKFLKWYEDPSNYNTVFDLKEKLPEYCCSDVQILTHSLVALRKEFFAVSLPNKFKNPSKGSIGIDILQDSMTIASACIKHWAMNYVKEDELAIIREQGYDNPDTQSNIALKWLAWYGKTNRVSVQTAESPEGEHRVKRADGGTDYRVDGFVRRPGHPRGDLALEVNGCRYHGCRKCYPDDSQQLTRDKTAGQLRAKDQERLRLLRQQMEVRVVWTCDIEREMSRDAEMRRFFRGYRCPSPIRIRDSFYGGRTGPQKLYQRLKPGYKISYKDFTSLYPWTYFLTSFPLGHPALVEIPRNKRRVNWTHPSQNPYKGIVKVLLLPPHDIKVPIMPMKLDANKKQSRLLFPLCRACACKYPSGARLRNYTCNHPPLRRAFISTCTHLELNKCLENGYRVLEIFKVLEWEKWSDEIFRGYVKDFMKLKIHASGFTDWCKTEEQKDEYIRENEQKFGIVIEKEKMIPNAGRRYLAKLCLNSLWGRFSLRNNLTKSVIVDNADDLEMYLSDPKIECKPVKSILKENEFGEEDDEIFLVSYKHHEDFIEENKYSNVVISLFTTSQARLHLWSALNTVAQTPGCEILYYDTDSVIYIHPIGVDPLPTGRGHLGEMTDEVVNHIVTEFVSAGCKNYCLKMLRKDGSGIYDVQTRVRGFTFDRTTSAIITQESMKKQVLAWGTKKQCPPVPITYPFSLRPNINDGTVYRTEITKNYQVVVTKGIVDFNHVVHPFGYRKF